jgi:hypothetical protein
MELKKEALLKRINSLPTEWADDGDLFRDPTKMVITGALSVIFKPQEMRYVQIKR